MTVTYIRLLCLIKALKLKMNFNRIKRHWPGILGVVFTIIVLILPKYSLDILLALIITLVCLGIYFYASKTNHKLLLKIVAFYILINFLVFPLLYLVTLKFDSNSFKIENTIANNEKISSLTELKSIYNPSELKESIRILKLLELEKSDKLNQKIAKLNNGDLIETNAYFLTKDCVPVESQRPMYSAVIKICNKKGVQLASIFDIHEGCMLSGNNTSIRSYLHSKKNKLSQRLKEYSHGEKDILKNNNFWSFHQIVTYSANAFSTSNLTPISRTANIIYYLHFFIGYSLLLTILISIVQKTIEKTKET